MIYVYIVASAVLMLCGEWAFDIFRQSWSFYGVPLIFIGLLLAFILLHLIFVVAILLLTKPKTIKKPCESFYRAILKYTLPMVFSLAGVRINISGTEKVPKDKRFLLVCNHQHDFDPAIIYYALPDSEIAFIGKKDIISEMPLIANAMLKLKCMFLDRENNREAAKTIVNAVKVIKADENSVALFPEGYTNQTNGELLPFRNGAFKVAYKAQVPIVVCAVNNTKSIVKNLLKRKTVVEFRVLDVIEPSAFLELHTNELGDNIYSIMNSAVNEMKK